jgi:hypothetical protein
MNFKAEKIVPEYLNLIGWRQHFDPTDFVIPEPLTVTETGEYYQQKHPALALDVIQTLIPESYELDKYLVDVVTDSTNEIFNDLIQYRQLKDYGKTILENATLLNKYGSLRDRIVNQSRFVGFQIRTKGITGLTAIIEAIGLQFDGVSNFNLYLFHSSKNTPIKTIPATTTGNGWDWTLTKEELSAYNSDEYHGGVFILGYYQDDLNGVSAINYSNFDWNKGECSSCNNTHWKTWRSIRQHFQVFPLYVPDGSFTKEVMFDLNEAFYTNEQSFGLNLKFSAVCDLTDFFIQNKFAFKNLLALKVTYKILNMMKFSQEINSVEENIKMMIIRDLEGDIDTKLLNIPTQYHKELKAVTFNISGINGVCLNCEEDGHGPIYGVV